MVDIDSTLDWFSSELKRRMNYLELWPRDVSYHCKVSSSAMNNYLQGKTFPSPWTLILIADLLETTVNELLDFDEPDEDSLVGYDPFSIFDDEDEFAIHVSNRVKLWMAESDIDIFKLSERTGFTRRTIRRWFGLSDKQPELPRTSDLLKICDALGCTPSDLLGY